MKYITLYTADDSYEADFIKNQLADEGIACMLTHENFTTLMPLFNGMLGAGIQVLIDKKDYLRAKVILDKSHTKDVHICPNCHSTHIHYGLGTKHRFKKLLALGIALLIGSPVRHIKQTYSCKDCKTEF